MGVYEIEMTGYGTGGGKSVGEIGVRGKATGCQGNSL